MAAIDDKMRELEFVTTTAKTSSEVRRLLGDAAEVAQGEKITLSDVSDGVVSGVARNFVRVQHAIFSFAVTPDATGATSVQFRLADYLRTRDTLFYFIPVSPWSAPAYKTLREFTAYIRARL